MSTFQQKCLNQQVLLILELAAATDWCSLTVCRALWQPPLQDTLKVTSPDYKHFMNLIHPPSSTQSSLAKRFLTPKEWIRKGSQPCTWWKSRVHISPTELRLQIVEIVKLWKGLPINFQINLSLFPNIFSSNGIFCSRTQLSLHLQIGVRWRKR